MHEEIMFLFQGVHAPLVCEETTPILSWWLVIHAGYYRLGSEGDVLGWRVEMNDGLPGLKHAGMVIQRHWVYNWRIDMDTFITMVINRCFLYKTYISCSQYKQCAPFWHGRFTHNIHPPHSWLGRTWCITLLMHDETSVWYTYKKKLY